VDCHLQVLKLFRAERLFFLILNNVIQNFLNWKERKEDSKEFDDVEESDDEFLTFLGF
jgi:hypothetical protein